MDTDWYMDIDFLSITVLLRTTIQSSGKACRQASYVWTWPGYVCRPGEAARGCTMTFCYVLKSGMQIDCAQRFNCTCICCMPPIHVDKIVQAYSCMCMHSSHVQALPHVGWTIGASQQWELRMAPGSRCFCECLCYWRSSADAREQWLLDTVQQEGLGYPGARPGADLASSSPVRVTGSIRCPPGNQWRCAWHQTENEVHSGSAAGTLSCFHEVDYAGGDLRRKLVHSVCCCFFIGGPSAVQHISEVAKLLRKQLAGFSSLTAHSTLI